MEFDSYGPDFLKEITYIAKEVFLVSEGGKRILEHLDRMTTRESTLCANSMLSDIGNTSLNPSDMAFIREGQNSVVRYIKYLIRLNESIEDGK